ncbi:hypothetical protein BaRGS_00038695 [Batillaria attramentaria]|uniref:AAA+ ATPase domain-containing protein n=1 Tax=Batillaria attramentaria TaxID=370345 RepID=A0ABD0J554_9CAEN
MGEPRKPPEEWRENVRQFYPDLNTTTYFVPPIFFRRRPHYTRLVPQTGQLVNELPDPEAPTTRKRSSGQASYKAGEAESGVERGNRPQERGLLLQDPSGHKGELLEVPQSGARGEIAEEHVFHCLQELAKQPKQERMVVLSQLSFGRHPNKSSYAPTAVEFGMPEGLFGESEKGECDFLIISRKYGLVIIEVKAVGSWRTAGDSVPSAIKKALNGEPATGPKKRKKGAIEQLNNAREVLGKLLRRFGLRPQIAATIALPYVTPDELKEAADNDFEESLRKCLCATDLQHAVRRCLCTDQFSSFEKPSSVSKDLVRALQTWWEAAVVERGLDDTMTDDKYETLVAIFCGSAVRVCLATLPSASVRTLGEAVAEYGFIIAQLTLHRSQRILVNKALAKDHQRVFLYGPPGTGKTVVLALVGLKWMAQGHDVYVLITSKASRAICYLLRSQLQISYRREHRNTKQSATSSPHVYLRQCSFDTVSTGSKELIDLLAQRAEAKKGNLHILIDEAEVPIKADRSSRNLYSFCSQLAEKVPKVRIWAASMREATNTSGDGGDNTDSSGSSRSDIFTEVEMGASLRCSPAVTSEVKKSQHYDNPIPPYADSPSTGTGPKSIALRHRRQKDHDDVTHPKKCKRCGIIIAEKLASLDVGTDNPRGLKYRDVLILCSNPDENLGMVCGLKGKGIPVLVVGSKADDDLIRKMALMETDKVIVTTWQASLGLERDVVIGTYVVGETDLCRPYGMSRCRSLLYWFDPPKTDELWQ